jgi:hypothetical protein
MKETALALTSGLIAGLLVLGLQYKLDEHRETQRVKLEVVRKIVGDRAAVSTNPIAESRPEFFQGLNEAMIVFADSREVIQALEQYLDNRSIELLIRTVKLMCSDAVLIQTLSATSYSINRLRLVRLKAIAAR